jgi:hypothetical protein
MVVIRSLVLCICFVDRCLSFCPFSFDHCVDISEVICDTDIHNGQPSHGGVRKTVEMIKACNYVNSTL